MIAEGGKVVGQCSQGSRFDKGSPTVVSVSEETDDVVPTVALESS